MADHRNESEPPAKESWMEEFWRPFMACVYAILVLFDYVVRPILNYSNARNVGISEVVGAVRDLDPTIAVRVVDTFANPVVIPPVLPEFVHITFAAILGVSALRGVQIPRRGS